MPLNSTINHFALFSALFIVFLTLLQALFIKVTGQDFLSRFCAVATTINSFFAVLLLLSCAIELLAIIIANKIVPYMPTVLLHRSRNGLIIQITTNFFILSIEILTSQ